MTHVGSAFARYENIAKLLHGPEPPGFSTVFIMVTIEFELVLRCVHACLC